MLTVTSGTTAVGGYSMRKDIEELELPWSVEQIEANAFRACANLRTITFIGGSELQKIGRCAFHSCTALNYLSLASVVELGESCF